MTQPIHSTPSQEYDYDIAIIGAGIAGAALGAVLARQGQRVVICEAKAHPRFAIGESTILETAETLRALATLYDVPELAYFSSENYFAYIGTSHGVKRHFSFLRHTPGQAQDRHETLQAVIPKYPHGHEVHLYRQDSDYYLTSVAVHYGADVLQNTPVQEIELDPDGVTLVTGGGRRIRAKYVVDAGGYRSLLAERFDLRRTDLRTHSRGLFTHMVDVPCFHDVSEKPDRFGIPFRVSEGTLHHVFEGGWLWVIPFNNYSGSTNPLCSVGLLLDPRIHPPRNDLTPAQEFDEFVGRFPEIAVQFNGARAVRDWTRAGRIQYSSKQVVGERWCLLGHAAGFIDPLYSKGLYTSLMSVSVLADLLLDAAADRDYSATRFAPLETLTLRFIENNDRLIAASYKSFANNKLWVVMAVQWLLGAYTEYVKLLSIRVLSDDRPAYYKEAHQLRLAGGGFAEFDAVAERIYALIEAVDPCDEAAVDGVVTEARAIYDALTWMPEPFYAVLDGKTTLPKNKLRPGLLAGENSFMRSGSYRKHFFGDSNTLDLMSAFVRETVTYSAPVLTFKKRFGHI